MTGESADRSRPGAHVSARWAQWRAAVDLDEYDRRWDHQAAAGADVHGEADLVASLVAPPASVLDAGCGAGRVAIELARRGYRAAGVDLDDELLAYARRRSPELDWWCADLATMDLGRRFDVIVQAGNVINFCRPEHRGAVVAAAARHLEPGGRLVVGFSIEAEVGPDGGRTDNATVYELAASAAGLECEARWSSWDRDPFRPADHYAVFVHRSGPMGLSG